MLWRNTHARSRKRLSPYIDGQLSPQERTTLEAHLAGCDACGRELDELRATISAVGGLADVEAPRSFALSPRMLERRAAVPPAAVPPLATGMRLAGAGLAAALTVVLIGDFASMGGRDSGSEGGGMRQMAEIQMSDLDNRDAAAGAPVPAATGAAEEDAFIGAERTTPNNDLAASADKTEACSPAAAGAGGNAQDAGGGVGGPVTVTKEATPTPDPAPTASPVPPPEAVGAPADCAPAVADIAPEEDSPAAVEALRDGDEGEFVAPAESSSRDDGGVSTLTVLKIILGGGLVALVGAITVEYVLRRRAA